jgi:hypothetical protein
MKRINLAIGVALCLASVGQWGLMRETLRDFGLPTLLGLPGFEFAILFGFEGHPGHSPLAPYVEFLANAAMYFFIVYLIIWLISKLVSSDSGNEIERRIYDHR